MNLEEIWNGKTFVIGGASQFYLDFKDEFILALNPYIRNYNDINKNILNIQIAEKIILKGGECVAILKTFWIRIIQRTWKRVFRKYLFDKYLRELRGYKVLNKPLLLRGMLK